MRTRSKSFRPLKFIVPAVIIGILAFIAATQLRDGSFATRGPMAYEDAAARLNGFMDDVTWREAIINQVATVELQGGSLEDSLPAINTFPLVVRPHSAGAVTAEIFASTEKSGSGTDGWMVEAAEAFNEQGKRLKNGKTAKISIRKIASGTGYQFIASRKYLPDAFSPSNHLWVRMAEGRAERHGFLG